MVYSDRSPALFPIIRDWLTGYHVFPMVPVPGMTPEVALRNLYKDAVYYGLPKLQQACRQAHEETLRVGRVQIGGTTI